MKLKQLSTMSWQANLLYMLLFCLLPVSGLAQGDQVVGEVIRLQGEVSVIRAARTAAVTLGDDVQRNDQLISFENALLEVQFTDGSSFTLDENAQVAIAQYAPGTAPRSLLQLTRGRLRSQVSNAFSSRQDSYKVATREGVMGVQGTVFEVIAGAGETSVYVYSGVVSATSMDPAFTEPVLLRSGDFLNFRLGEPLPQPVRFMGVVEEPDSINAVVGSGGVQALISGGDQTADPTAPAATSADQPAGAMGVVLPPPRPPSGG